MALIHGPSKKQISFNHAIMDQDAFIADLVNYFVVKEVYVADQAYKRDQMAELAQKLSDDKDLGLLG